MFLSGTLTGLWRKRLPVAQDRPQDIHTPSRSRQCDERGSQQYPHSRQATNEERIRVTSGALFDVGIGLCQEAECRERFTRRRLDQACSQRFSSDGDLLTFGALTDSCDTNLIGDNTCIARIALGFSPNKAERGVAHSLKVLPSRRLTAGLARPARRRLCGIEQGRVA
ncbi:MAG: hypothetical protein LBL59_08510 [Xanthomonadaceae bacterium]|jgi:hypothetical protein|nr:hypothetical protein [Xanthomonadaceae bacterium]